MFEDRTAVLMQMTDADDILLLAPSVTELQRIVWACELELTSLDMTINASKSYCVRIGPRHNLDCADIITLNGQIVPWVDEIRYLGIYFTSHVRFRCIIDYAKRAFYRSANEIFGKVGRSAPEQVTLHLLASKCIPILLYGLEACDLNKSTRASLDFPVLRFAMKLLKTANVGIVDECLEYFGILKPSAILTKKELKFEAKISSSDNCLL
jgi:hypothetical protein